MLGCCALMRARVVTLGLLLGVMMPAVPSAQPKKPLAGGQKKGHGASKPGAPEAPPAVEPAGPDSPYGAAAGSAPAGDEAPAAGEPSGSSDPKLDEPPPSRKEEKEGPKRSPLTPEPNEFAKGPPPTGPAELDKLMAEIATLRARVASLTTSLFSSKLAVSIETEGDDARIQSLVVTLDDGVVFTSGAGFVAEDGKRVYEHAVAPGNHVIGVEIERADARGATFRTWQSSRFAIQVPERKTLLASVSVEDDSDMAEDFPDDQDGTYELSVELRAAVEE